MRDFGGGASSPSLVPSALPRPADHVAIYVGSGQVIDSPYGGASDEMIAMTSLPVWSDFAGATRVASAT